MFIQKNELAWINDPNNHNNIQQPQQGTSNGQVLPTFLQTLQQAFRRFGPLSTSRWAMEGGSVGVKNAVKLLSELSFRADIYIRIFTLESFRCKKKPLPGWESPTGLMTLLCRGILDQTFTYDCYWRGTVDVAVACTEKNISSTYR